MKNNPVHRLAFASLLTLAACSPKPQPAPPAPVTFKPAASIQNLMVSIVDPAADALWEAVSTETTASGVKENQPRTEQEWQAVRHHAIALQEAGNLLMMEGREVTHGGKVTEDAHVEGVSGRAAGWRRIRRQKHGGPAPVRPVRPAQG